MKNRTLLSVWNQLKKVQQLTCNMQSKELTLNGKAQVSLIKEGSNVLIFHEKGSWSRKEEISFTNTLRWTLDLDAGILALEHLRYGLKAPTFLVHLVPFTSHLLTSMHSHVCKDDTYTAKMSFDHSCVHLNWHVVGPKKNEEIHSYYF